MEGKAPIAKQSMNVPLALKYNLELFLSPGSELPALWARALWLQGSDRLPPPKLRLESSCIFMIFPFG